MCFKCKSQSFVACTHARTHARVHTSDYVRDCNENCNRSNNNNITKHEKHGSNSLVGNLHRSNLNFSIKCWRFCFYVNLSISHEQQEFQIYSLLKKSVNAVVRWLLIYYQKWLYLMPVWLFFSFFNSITKPSMYM